MISAKQAKSGASMNKVDSTSSNVSGGQRSSQQQPPAQLRKDSRTTESHDSSFAGGGLADQNYNSSDDEAKSILDKLEETKSVVRTSSRPGTDPKSLPDMWNQSEAKRGDGYLIFGAHPKTSADSKQPVPVSKLNN